MRKQDFLKLLRVVICALVLVLSSNTLAEARILGVGESVFLHRDMLAARTMEDYDLMNEFLRKRNMEGVVRMMLDGRVYELHQGNKADVIERGWTYYRLYMANGVHAGRRVYVSQLFFED